LSKPVATIYNPVAGRRNDLRELINHRFSDVDLSLKFYTTEHTGHAYEIAQGINFDEFSALMIVGGDGTVSEAISGMLSRKDGKRLPVSVIPNGYSNDFAFSLGIKNYDQGLDFLLRRETVKVDALRVLFDVDDDSELPEGPERLKSCRYMMAGSSLSMPAKIASASKSLGFCCGGSSLVSFYKGVKGEFQEDQYNLECDHAKVGEDGNIGTAMMIVSNGKYINGGAIFNPYSCINDGMIDIAWVRDPSYSGYWGLSGLMKKATSCGGTQVFDGHSCYMRAKTIKLAHEGKENTISVDNEDVTYQSFVKFDATERIDVFVETDSYFTEHNSFV